MREKIVDDVLQNCTFLANRGLLKLFVILSSGSVLNGRESAFITHLHYYLRRVKLSWPDPDKNISLLILLSGNWRQFNVDRGRSAMISKDSVFCSPKDWHLSLRPRHLPG